MVSKEEIKQAAFRLFAEKGYEAASTQDIAEAVGLKKQSLYSHFKSKSEIFEEVLKDQSSMIVAELKNILESEQSGIAELYLKKVFETMIQKLSESFLFLKRSILLSTSKNRQIFAQNFIDQFNGTLKSSLYDILSNRYGLIQDPDKFVSFYSYFMLHVYGYMDIFIVEKADESVRQDVWQQLWTASKAFFND
jgi:Transcriptional regulator